MIKLHWILLGVITLISILADFVFLADYPNKHWWSYIPAFYIIWGFIGCVGIIYISKWLGKIFLQKKEDYYDAG
ncbi:MAG: hypothetical protein KGZ42_00160 [Melioribacter sp.]|nr:hypothetical protein [Melioribacter sp.]